LKAQTALNRAAVFFSDEVVEFYEASVSVEAFSLFSLDKVVLARAQAQ
jgi:hypothetical protein